MTSEDGFDPDLLARLEPPGPGRVRMVLDTDTYNEIDDQFALVWAMLSPERLDVEAIHAAPFLNDRSCDPADGMERSHEEILRILDRLGVKPDGLVRRGSTSFLPADRRPVASDAVDDLIRRAHAEDDRPLYVAAIAALTNVASAILTDPSILERIVVVWLGGQSRHMDRTDEFNLSQDVRSAQVVLDSGVPLVRVPCYGAASHLLTTLGELEDHIGGTSDIGDELVRIFRNYRDDHFAYAKEIWDLAPVAWLLDPNWIPTRVLTSPVLTDEHTWETDPSRHPMREGFMAHRNQIFADLFHKIADRA